MSISVKNMLRATGTVTFALVLCLALVLGLTACGDDDSTDTTDAVVTTQATQSTVPGMAGDAAALVGKWYCEKPKETLEFTADGQLIWTKSDGEPRSFPFSVKDGVIVFTQPNAPVDNELPYTLQGGTLTTDDPKYGTLTYTKQ